MIIVSNDYKSALTKPRQIDAKIIIGLNTITSDYLNQIKRSFNTSLFKTVAKMVEIDSNTTISKGTIIEPKFGLYINGAFEYASLGLYKVRNDPNLKKDTNSYEITAYDEIVESMVNYELTDSDISYPCTVKEMFEAIFTKLGWSTSGIPASFTNSTSQIEEDVYSNVNMTYRDVLDELCTISCMFLVDNDGEPKLITKNTTSQTINEDYFRDTNVEVGEQVFFNSLVFSRANGSDNIIRKDDTSITNNGLHEFKVNDLQILSLNWRDNFIDAMWNYIKTFTYYAYDINTIGITFLEPIDEFTISTFNSTYATLLLNSDLTIGGGLNEKIYATSPKETETEYKYAGDLDKKINQTNLIVDKQNQVIQGLVTSTKVVSDEITATGSFQLNNAYVGGLHYLSIKGNIQPIYSSNTLYPSDTLYILEPILLVDTTEYRLDIDHLNYISSSVCDEFVYEDGKCKIIRRVGVDQYGDLYALDNEVEEERNDINIEVNSNSTIQMKQYSNLNYKCVYLLANDYTSVFASKVETTSELNILSDKIEQKVTQVADDNGNVTSASIILAVNNDSSVAEISAKKINLNGVVTANSNFRILEDGSMEANNGTFNGTINGGAILITGNFTEQDPYIEIENQNSTSSEPIGTRLWSNGISCYDYSGNETPVIRTETSDGFAELSGSVVNAYGFNNVSLETKKKNFEPLKSGIEILNNIDIYKYNYKDEKDNDKKHIGLVIGDNYKYSKEITSQNNEEIDIYSFVSVCCKAIQELQKEIEKLKKERK